MQGSFTCVFDVLQNIHGWDTLNPSRIINVRRQTACSTTNPIHSTSIRPPPAADMNLSNGWFHAARRRLFRNGLWRRVAAGRSAIPFKATGRLASRRQLSGNGAITVLGFYDKIRRTLPLHREWPGFLILDIDTSSILLQLHPAQPRLQNQRRAILAATRAPFRHRRTFPSGLRVGLWYTPHERRRQCSNDHRYYDEDFASPCPLELYDQNKAAAPPYGYAMAAWLRDCGARDLHRQRMLPHPLL